jgi:lysophospholipid acyltransferase (LPLAT)-like uncharacterized protein
MKESMRYRLGSRAGQIALDALLRTCRWEEHGSSRYDANWRTNSGLIFAHWHGRLLPLSYHHRGRGLVPIISKSGDGEYIARIVEHWGYRPVRGSSSRGGTQALREMVKRARKGSMLVFTPDGPRGPRNEVKPGVLLAAQLSGLPIVPASSAATSAWWFEGWDRFMVPKPFARVVVGFAEPIYVARDADESEMQRTALQLKKSIDSLTAELDALVA